MGQKIYNYVKHSTGRVFTEETSVFKQCEWAVIREIVWNAKMKMCYCIFRSQICWRIFRFFPSFSLFLSSIWILNHSCQGIWISRWGDSFKLLIPLFFPSSEIIWISIVRLCSSLVTSVTVVDCMRKMIKFMSSFCDFLLNF